MATTEFNLDLQAETAAPSAQRAPWLAFLFLFGIFAFATPFELDYTIRRASLDEKIENMAEGALGRKLAMPALGAYGLWLLVGGRSRRLKINGLLGLAFGGYLALAFISLFWSEDLLFTTRKLAVFGLLMLGAIGMAARFSLKEVMQLALMMSCGVLSLGLSTELALGTFLRAPENAVYQFAGVMHSNALSCYCALGVFSAFSLSKLEPQRRRFYLTLMMVGLGFLFLIKSRTAFGGTVVVLSLIWTATTDLKRKVVTFLCAGTICCALGLAFSDDLAGRLTSASLLGREQEGTAGSLSNRLPLWRECLDYMAERPLLGYGYESFWTPQRAYTIARGQGWVAEHSHNGYLEMALSLGVVGLAVFALVLGAVLNRTFTAWRSSGDAVYLYAFAVMVWLCLEMLLEKVYLFPIFPSFVCNLLIARFAFAQVGEQQPEWSFTWER